MRVGDENLPDTINLYQILGLQSLDQADQLAIKKAYKKLVLLHHPDHGGDTEKFILVNKAYRILSNPSLKRQYDNLRKSTKSDSYGIYGAGKGAPAGKDAGKGVGMCGKEDSQTTKSIMEELRWIEQFIKKAWDFYNEFQRLQALNKSYNHPLQPVQPVEPVEPVDPVDPVVPVVPIEIPKPWLQGDFREIKRNYPMNPLDDRGKRNGQTEQNLMEKSFDIEVTATLRQYMLKRWKKVKIQLPKNNIVMESAETISPKPPDANREHILKIPLYIMNQRIVLPCDYGKLIINISLIVEPYVDERTGLKWSLYGGKFLITQEPLRQALTQISMKTVPPPIGSAHNLKDYEPRVSRQPLVIGPDGLEYLFEVEPGLNGLSPINTYHSADYRFIVCLSNPFLNRGETSGVDELKRKKIVLKPFESIESLVTAFKSA
jgi:curved DNA-binding protein CbpA